MGAVCVYLFLILCLILSAFTWKLLTFEYAIEGKYLVIRWYYIGLLPGRLRVRLDSIIRTEKIPFAFSLFFRFDRRLLFGRPSHELVLITRKRGLLRNLVISPSNPDEFIAELSKRIHKSGE